MKKDKNKSLPSIDLGPEIVVDAPKAAPNEYLRKIAVKLRILCLITVVFLVVFILGMILIFRNDITVENYKYLIRFFTTTETEYNGEYQSIFFESNGTTVMDIFHSDLAVLKNSGLTLYNMSGNTTLNQSLSYSTPALISNGRYMLTYDIGGYTFDLFNNFSRLAGQTYEYPIACAAVSSEGMYAVVTKSLEYQSVVYLYDHNFNLITKIFKDKYVMSVSINDDASEILVVATYAEGGSYQTEISTYAPYKQDATSTEIRPQCLGIQSAYHSDGSYTVLCTDAILFFNSKNDLVSSYPLTNVTPSKCIIADTCTAFTYNESIVGSNTSIIAFDNSGNLICATTIDSKVLDIDCISKKIMVLGSGRLYEIDMDSQKQRSAEIETGASSLFLPDLTTVILSYSNKAQPKNIEDILSSAEYKDITKPGGIAESETHQSDETTDKETTQDEQTTKEPSQGMIIETKAPSEVESTTTTTKPETTSEQTTAQETTQKAEETTAEVQENND